MVNDLALEVMFEHRHKRALAELPCTWEANMDNFDEDGKQLEKTKMQPMMTKVFKGLRVFLTKNLNKREDFVNGMLATVEEYDDDSGCLSVITKTGKRLAIFAIEEYVEKCGTVTYYPIRVGYASTVQKIQGQTLPHVTLFLDRMYCRAAGYVALSRVAMDSDYLVAGKIITKHFVPAK